MSKKNYMYMLAGTGLLVTGVATGLVFSTHAQTTTTTSNSSSSIASQVGGHRGGKGGDEMGRPDSAQFTAIQTAITNKDFSAWQTAITASNAPDKTELLAKINASNFDTYVQLVNAEKSKDFNTADSLRTQLGLSTPPGKAENQAVQKALAANDYSAWKTAVAALPNSGGDLLTKIDTQAKFDQLVQAYNLHEQAQTIEKSLGIQGFGGGHQGGMQGQGGKMGNGPKGGM